MSEQEQAAPSLCGVHECRDRARWRVQYWRCPDAPSPLAHQLDVCGLHRKRWPVPWTILIGVVGQVVRPRPDVRS